ncbi:MAG: hypothetical protein ACRDWI_18305 [Jiangellaceae bacterium]
MTRFELPRGDPAALGSAAHRLVAAADHVQSCGRSVSAAAAGSAAGWSGLAVLAMSARAHDVARVTDAHAIALRDAADATLAYARQVDLVRGEIATLNRRHSVAWDDAHDERRRIQAMPPDQRALFAGRDPLAELRATEQVLQRSYDDATERLRNAGRGLGRAIADPLAGLPGWVAHGLPVAQGLKASHTLATRGLLYGRWLAAGRRAGGDPLWELRASQRLDAFRHGSPVRPGAPFGQFRQVAGRVFLPATIVGGVVDAGTGGGYDGGRGVATRALGAAGAAGAVGVLALTNPVGLTVAGGAVLAYGAWSLGNLAWDNRRAIGSFVRRSAGAIRSALGRLASW